jgi:type I restriction enzyme S subunit
MSDRGKDNGPPGWKRTTLGETLPIRYGKARNEKYGTVREDTPVYGSSGRIDTFGRALTGGPSLIIGRKGTVGATYYCPEPCWPIDTVYFTEAPADEDLRFFKYLLDHLQLARMDRSTAVPGLSRDDYNATDVFIPELDQQRLIVAEIEKQFSRLDEAVANLKRVKANLKRYKASVLKAAVEGKFVSVDPSRWTRTNLGTVLTTIEAGKSFKCEERLPNIHEIGVVKVSAVTWGTYNEEESKTCLDPDRIETRYFVKPGDFLFSRANTIQLVGACVIAQKVTQKIMLSDKILRFHFSDIVVPQWVLYWLRSDIGRKEIQRLSTGNQESMRNIGQDRIRQVAFALPSLEEQRAIVAEVERHLSMIEKLEAALGANLTRAERLRQAILASLFGTQCRNAV